VSLNHDGGRSFVNILAHVKEELSILDNALNVHLDSSLPLFRDVGLHLISGGGKRLRPALCFLCAKFLDRVSDDHIKGAMCLELIHNATLLHDDVLDRSSVRRGRPTAHHLWTESHSILTGDFLLCKALELLTEVENWAAVRLVHGAATQVIEGQALEMVPSTLSIGDQEDHYTRIISLKTAPLFEAAAGLAGILSHVSENQIKALRTCGRLLGISFQLVDDILDYKGEERLIGKRPGQDFREKKVTLPVILAFQKGNQGERAFWTRAFGSEDITDTDLDHAMALMEQHGSFKEILKRAKGYASKAQESLCLLAPPLKDTLESVFELIQDPVRSV
jgi:octaprenyl-diphosphate synthase